VALPVGPSRWALPDPDQSDSHGLVGVGADLEPETLVDAYRRGIFPWPHEGMPLPWFSPDPRAVLWPERVRVPRSLRQRLRRSGWATTVDAAFAAVVGACAEQPRGEGTWITNEMQRAYTRMHELGWVHSVEVWDGDVLVGGLYGVQIGGVFTGESMFHDVDDASKVALVDLAARFGEAGGAFIDVQLPTEHLERMGAVAVPRSSFLGWLAKERDRCVELPVERRAVSRLAPGR
jgi:leucyl/phenylalanyl-tRNA---protein transferase